MRFSSQLSSRELALVEELVVWGAKVKDVAWVLRHPAAEASARACYEAVGRRPPSGSTASVTSDRRRAAERMRYAALAAEYLDAIARGNDQREAMLAVYRRYFVSAAMTAEGSAASVSVWMELTRQLACHIAELVRCPGCGGQQLLDRNDPYKFTSCLWCGRSMPAYRAKEVPRQIGNGKTAF